MITAQYSDSVYRQCHPWAAGVTIVLLSMVMVCSIAQTATADAADSERSQVVPTLSQRSAKQFSRIEKSLAIALRNHREYEKTLVLLRKIEAKSSAFSAYEKAQLWRYFGFVHFSLRQHNKAISFYEKVVGHDSALPQGVVADTLYTLGQLYFTQQQYMRAIDRLQRWLTSKDDLNADVAVLLAYSYYHTEQFVKATQFINQAISMHEAKGLRPQERWYVLSYRLAYEQKQYRQAVNRLTYLLNYYPKESYLRQLSALYGVLKQPKKQLATLETLYNMKAFTHAQDFINLASLYLQQQYPYRAASILQHALSTQSIADNTQHNALLAMAWIQAKETEKAIVSLKRAVTKSGGKNGKHYERLSLLYFDQEQYDLALSASRKALQDPRLKQTQKMHLLQGIIFARRYDCASANAAFSAIERDAAYLKQAQQWLSFCTAQ